MQWIGFIVGLGGVSSVVLAGGGIGGLALGDSFVFLSIAAQVLSFLVIAKAAKTLDPRIMTAYMMVVGSVVLFIISLIQEPGEIKAFATVPPLFWLGIRSKCHHRHCRRTHALQLLSRKSRPIQSRHLHQLQHHVLPNRLSPFPRRNHHLSPSHRPSPHHRRRYIRIRRRRRSMEKTS